MTKPLQNVKNEKGNVSVFKRQKQNDGKKKGIVKAGRHYIHVLCLETAGKDDWITHSNGKETKKRKKENPIKVAGHMGGWCGAGKERKQSLMPIMALTPPQSD